MRAPKYPLMAATFQGLGGRPITGTTVAEAVRLQRDALLYSDSRVPLTGQYYDKFRATQQVRTSAPREFTNPQVRGINNKAGGVKSFAAATYQYPSGQMVIGAALAGMDVSTQTRLAKARLAGLGAIDESLVDTERISAGSFGIGADEEDGAVCGKDTGKGGCVQVKINRVRKALKNVRPYDVTDAAIQYFAAMKWAAIDSIEASIRANWDNFLNGVRAPDSNYSPSLLDRAKALYKDAKEVADKIPTGGGGGGSDVGPAAPPVANKVPPRLRDGRLVTAPPRRLPGTTFVVEDATPPAAADEGMSAGAKVAISVVVVGALYFGVKALKR